VPVFAAEDFVVVDVGRTLRRRPPCSPSELVDDESLSDESEDDVSEDDESEDDESEDDESEDDESEEELEEEELEDVLELSDSIESESSVCRAPRR